MALLAIMVVKNLSMALLAIMVVKNLTFLKNPSSEALYMYLSLFPLSLIVMQYN